MEKIIEPVDIALIKAELTPERKLCDTNKGGNVIYVIDGECAPNTLREIGRLREISYRQAGGSSGLALDLDEFDTMEVPYRQIVVWDPDAEAILGGYRYILGPDVVLKDDGQPRLASAHMFHFSDNFIRNYLPHTIELGRSFVQPDYQSSKAGAKSIFAMDNLWDGITAIILNHPGIIYLFGKMTMYPSYDKACRDLILHFLWKHFPDPEELVRPYEPVMPQIDGRLLGLILNETDLKPDYRRLKDAVRKLGTNIPPLVNSYMNTSPTMKMLGTAVNEELSNIEDTGILVCFNEIYPDKLDRHKEAYFRDMLGRAKKRFPSLSGGEMDERLKDRQMRRRERAFFNFKKQQDKQAGR